VTGGEKRTTVSSVAFDLPNWPGLGEKLEVSVLCDGISGPEALLGTWVFTGASPGSLLAEIDWLSGGADALSLKCGEAGAPSLLECLRNEDAVVRPGMVLRLSADGGTIELPFKVTDTEALERYYQGESHQDEYVVQHPFFTSFHAARLRELGTVFNRRIPPGSKVLDVGSGYSIFFLIGQDWDFEVTCCDLDSAAMHKMQGLMPSWEWLVSDAVHLPFEDGQFDAVYAGEIIEHVGDVREALTEWRRVLADGGTLILTTPNRDRLLARANRRAMPVHPEHVMEMSLPQAKALLLSCGFEVLDVTGIYLELALNWYRPVGSRVDMLVSLFGQPGQERIYKPFMWAGKLAPSRSFDLILTCKKR